MKTRRSRQTADRSRWLSRQQRLALLALGVAGGMIGGGWWLYYTLTTVPPPDVQMASTAEVVSFLGNGRGYARLSIDRREAYLGQAYRKYGTGAARQQIHQSFTRMTTAERRVFVDATIEVLKTRFIEQARPYNRMRGSQKTQFVDRAIRSMEATRRELVGGGTGTGGSAPDLGMPFEDEMPKDGDGLTKRLLSATSPAEREEGQELAEAIAARYKQLRDPGERRRFDNDGSRR